jgi:hypothetical protein
MTASKFTHVADMGFTRAELLKGLKTAVFPYQVVNLNTDMIKIVDEDRVVRLTTGKDGFRAIASMQVPKLSVQLEFINFDQDQFERFMQRFRKYLHKGGG